AQRHVGLLVQAAGGGQQRAAHQAGGLAQVGGPKRQAQPGGGPRSLDLAGIDRQLRRQGGEVGLGGRVAGGGGRGLQAGGRLGDVGQVPAADRLRFQAPGQECARRGGVRVRQ